DRERNESLADVVQQRGAGQAALVGFAHAEMLRERHCKAGHEQAVTMAVGVMAADRGQPFAGRGVIDRPEDGLGLGVAGMSDVATVSTSPTERRILASSPL